GVDELAADAQAVYRLANAAFEHVPHTQLAAHLFDVDRLALVGEAGIAGDDEQRLEARQSGDDVLDHPVREILLLGITAHVLERQHGNGWLVGQRQRCWSGRRLRRHGVRSPVPDLNWPGDILKRLRSALVEGGVHAVAHILMHTARYADASGCCDLLQAGGDIDTVAKDVIAFDDDVTLVDANAKSDAPILGHPGGAVSHRRLHLDRTAHGI